MREREPESHKENKAKLIITEKRRLAKLAKYFGFSSQA